MSILGKIIAAPIRILNAPLRIMEDFVYDGKCPDSDRMPSVPLDNVAKGIEKAADYVCGK